MILRVAVRLLASAWMLARAEAFMTLPLGLMRRAAPCSLFRTVLCAGEDVDDKALYRELHRVGGGMFYKGVRGRSTGRGGVFSASSAGALADLSSLIEGERLLLENRKDGYEAVFAAEMRAFDDGALEMVCPGLWKSSEPLDRHRLGLAAALRGEMAPLLGPYGEVDVFLEAVRGKQFF